MYSRQDIADRRSDLRRALSRPTLARAFGVHDALGARIASEAGFDAAWLSGFELATSLCLPDADIITYTELAQVAAGICASNAIPVIVDCDAGYGSAANMQRMASALANVGVAAICIEDKQFPKLNSFADGRQLLAEIDDFCAKLRCLQDLRDEAGLVVIARTEALVCGESVGVALERAAAFADAGADAVLIHDRSESATAVLSFLLQWDGRVPVVVVPTTYGAVGFERLERSGAGLAICANHGIRATIQAVQAAAGILAASDSPDAADERLVSIATAFEYQGMSALLASRQDPGPGSR